MTALIIRIPNPEHEARCVAAIRERWRNEATFKTLPWYRQRDQAGRFRAIANRGGDTA